jgi:phosphoribosylformylglycinamidine synthase
MPPDADLDAAARLHALVADLVTDHEVAGVHDVSDGGLAVALCEMAFGGSTGFRVDLLAAPGTRSCTAAEAAFGESTSRVVVAVAPEQLAAVLGRTSAAGVAAAAIGQAGGDQCIADGAFSVRLEAARDAWRNAIPDLMRPH